MSTLFAVLAASPAAPSETWSGSSFWGTLSALEDDAAEEETVEAFGAHCGDLLKECTLEFGLVRRLQKELPRFQDTILILSPTACGQSHTSKTSYAPKSCVS